MNLKSFLSFTKVAQMKSCLIFFLFLFTFLPFISCSNNKLVKSYSLSSEETGPINEDAPARWAMNKFPLQVPLSTTFDTDERNLMQEMGNVWEDSQNDSINFFTMSNTTTNKDYASLDSYYDSEMGVYAAPTWFAAQDGLTLAVTQYFGTRKNIGTAQEYIDLDHADILINTLDFSFSSNAPDGVTGIVTPTPGTYDLPSVLIHELGHFLGLYHSGESTSVMTSSISQGTAKRVPTATDEEDMAANYGIDLSPLTGNGPQVLAMRGSEETAEESAPETWESVRVILELKKDGLCNHYVNGKKTFSHHIHLKRN